MAGRAGSDPPKSLLACTGIPANPLAEASQLPLTLRDHIKDRCVPKSHDHKFDSSSSDFPLRFPKLDPRGGRSVISATRQTMSEQRVERTAFVVRPYVQCIQ